MWRIGIQHLWDTALWVFLDRVKDLWHSASDKITIQNDVVSELIINVSVIDVINKKNDWSGLDTRGVLSNSLLSTIPSSELGESLIPSLLSFLSCFSLIFSLLLSLLYHNEPILWRLYKNEIYIFKATFDRAVAELLVFIF